jgi:hypothetical protein
MTVIEWSSIPSTLLDWLLLDAAKLVGARADDLLVVVKNTKCSYHHGETQEVDHLKVQRLWYATDKAAVKLFFCRPGPFEIVDQHGPTSVFTPCQDEMAWAMEAFRTAAHEFGHVKDIQTRVVDIYNYNRQEGERRARGMADEAVRQALCTQAVAKRLDLLIQWAVSEVRRGN